MNDNSDDSRVSSSRRLLIQSNGVLIGVAAGTHVPAPTSPSSEVDLGG